MARQIDFRAPIPHPTDDTYAAMVDADFLRARLRQLGGPGAELLSHRADATSADYRLRHGLDRTALPPLAQSLVSGDLVIERTESVRKVGPGDYQGTVQVVIQGLPVQAAGQSRLSATQQGSDFGVQATVTVKVPLIGGMIEETVAEQVKRLLEAETRFTQDWLRTRTG